MDSEPMDIDLIFDGEMETCEVEEDHNGEFVCTTPSGRFLKFPAGNLKKMAADHNKKNQ